MNQYRIYTKILKQKRKKGISTGRGKGEAWQMKTIQQKKFPHRTDKDH